MAEFNTKFHKV